MTDGFSLHQRLAADTARIGVAKPKPGAFTAALDVMEQARRDAWGELGSDVIDIATQSLEDYNEWVETVSDNLERLMEVSGYGGLAGGATSMRMYALEAVNAGNALDTVFRVTVSNTTAIGNQSQAIHDWAEELIGVQGEYSKLDDLVANGRITGQSGIFEGDSEYAQAQRAYNDIARENAEIQEHVLTIQAKQAPLVRDQLAAYEDYMNEVANMPAEQQLITLGWMDSTAAMRAMEFQTLAVAAATGELGANGEAVFTDMITGAAQADPVLKALLIDMGLISEGADGTITVNLAGAEGARSELSMLTEAIVNLIDLMDDNELNGSFSITAEDNASEVIRTVRDGRDELDGKTATGYLNADGSNATSTIGIVDESLGALDGSEAWVYAYAQDNASSVLSTLANTWGGVIATSWIDVVTRNVPGKANGGVVGEYATGGVVIRAGEISPEIISFANGGTAVLPYDGLYSVPEGSYISPGHASTSRLGGGAPSVTVNVNGPVFGMSDLVEQVSEVLVPVVAGVFEERTRGMGA